MTRYILFLCILMNASLVCMDGKDQQSQPLSPNVSKKSPKIPPLLLKRSSGRRLDTSPDSARSHSDRKNSDIPYQMDDHSGRSNSGREDFRFDSPGRPGRKGSIAQGAINEDDDPILKFLAFSSEILFSTSAREGSRQAQNEAICSSFVDKCLEIRKKEIQTISNIMAQVEQLKILRTQEITEVDRIIRCYKNKISLQDSPPSDS